MSATGSEAVGQSALQETIAQQRATISELQTPVIQVWEGFWRCRSSGPLTRLGRKT